MVSAKYHKARMDKIRIIRDKSHLKPLAKQVVFEKYLAGEIDTNFIESSNISADYTSQIQKFDLSVSNTEVLNLIDKIDINHGIEAILEPVFLSLFDGTIRAFKIGTKQGITASRLYTECKFFSYNRTSKNITIDSYTELLNERQNIKELGKETEFKNGRMSRNEKETNMRDGAKMSAAKDAHFGDELRAPDGYGGRSIYKNKKHAKSDGNDTQSAETDHVISCAEICNNLKSNKALSPDDIKEIVNTEANLVITGMQNNRGTNTGKFDKTKDELQNEIKQGYVNNVKGKKHLLSDEEKEIRRSMVKKMDDSQKIINSKTNKTVVNNIINDLSIQKRLTKDAINASSNQLIGDLVIFMIKPLHFELRDCIINGIEKGVGESNFKLALTTRFSRMKNHVLQEAGNLLKGGLFNFFKNFLSMLLEGIVNCFVGIFKNVVRMIKEGLKILLQIAPILKDETKSPAQKGDAILKLIVGSLSIFASIGIESWLNSLGLGEPWSVIVSSILTAVVTTLTMYLLEKIDIFGTNKALKSQRIKEVLSLKDKNTREEIFELISVLS